MNPPPIDVAFELTCHGEALRRLAGELLHDPATADDAVQQVWLETLRRPPRHRMALGGWFAMALRNVANAWRRRDRRRVRREQAAITARPSTAGDHADTHAREELAQRLLGEVAALSQPYRDAIWQRFFEGKAPRDIAAARGVPVTTVKSWQKRALATLRERLGEREGFDWRAGFAGAFGIGRDGAIAAKLAGGIVMATWVKVTSGVLAAAAGIALVMWWAVEPPALREMRQGADETARVASSKPNAIVPLPEREAAVAASQQSPVARVAAAVAPNGTIRGRAVDAVTKQPLAGVRAKLGSGKVDVNAPDPEVQTAADGTFELAVRAASSPSVCLSRGDRVETSCEVLLVPAGHVEQIGDVAMRRGRVLRGRLVAADGSPIPPETFVAIEFVRTAADGRRETTGAAYTGTDGVFESRSPIPIGPTTWQIPFGEFELRPPVQIEIGDEQPDEVVLRATRRASICGVVVDEAAQPVAGVGLADQPMSGGGAKTDADGRFTVLRMGRGDPPVGTVHFTELPGCEPHAPIADVPWGTADLRIVVKRIRPLQLEVVDEEGAPIEDFGVALQRAGLGFSPGKVRQRGRHAGGRLAVEDVARGATSLRVVPTSPQWTPSEPIQVGADESLRVVLQRRLPLPVLVHSGGEPVQDVTVELLRERGVASASVGTAIETKIDNVWMSGAAIEPITSGRTDAAGRVTLLRDGDLSNCVLRTRAGGEPPGIVRDLTAPPPGEPRRIELPRHGRITGRVELRGRPRDRVGIAIPSLHRMRGRAIPVGPDGTFDSGPLQTGAYRIALELSVNGRPFVVDAGARDVEVKADAATQVTFDVADCAFASVRGTVAGELPKGLIVELRRTGPGGGSELCASAEVGADGTFHVAETLPGTFQVGFRLTGSNALVAGMLAEPLVIAPGEEARPRLHYAVRRLVVKLRRPDGSVVRGERVLARCGGGVWPEHTFLTPGVDEQLVLDPAPLLPVEFRGWSTPDAWSTPVVMPPDRAELEVTVILPDGSR